MTLLEFNDLLLVNPNRIEVKVPTVTQDMCDIFRRIVASSRTMQNVYDMTDDANSFFYMFPDVKKLLGTGTCVEVFYACKLKFVYDGVPSKLVYIVNKMFSECGTIAVNSAINRTLPLLKPYVNDVYNVDGKSVTVKDVIENIAGFPIKLLTSSVPKVKATNCFEVYVRNVERVALLSPAIAKLLPYAECEKIKFDRELGLVIGDGDVILRCLCGALGIVKNDFDLTNCL